MIKSSPQDVIFCLAMHWGHKLDSVRMRALEERFLCTVISVSIYEMLGDTQHEHISSHFKYLRGIKSIAERITQLHTAGSKVDIILDHFWCQQSYYANNYGTNWLSEKCEVLLRAGADSIILPYDQGRCVTGISGMNTMLQGSKKNLLIKFLRPSKNPLSVASSMIPDTIYFAQKRPNNESQIKEYLKPTQEFVLVRLAEGISRPNKRRRISR